MKEEFVTFEQAKSLFELGFCPIESSQYYAIKDCWDGYDCAKHYNVGDVVCDEYGLSTNEKIAMPTQSLVQKWLREVKNIHVNPFYEGGGKFRCIISWYDAEYNAHFEDQLNYPTFDTYEDALSKGIDKAIKIIMELIQQNSHMESIEERAFKKFPKHSDSEMESEMISPRRNAYIADCKEQEAITKKEMVEKACNSFCKAQCLDDCILQNGFRCGKFINFRKAMEK